MGAINYNEFIRNARIAVDGNETDVRRAQVWAILALAEATLMNDQSIIEIRGALTVDQ